MTQAQLPSEFNELETYIQWALPNERERNQLRNCTDMAAIQSFYDAIFPRMEQIIEHLNGYPLDAMPAPEQRLLYLTLSLAEVANAVELFKQPDVIDGFPVERFIPPPDPMEQ